MSAGTMAKRWRGARLGLGAVPILVLALPASAAAAESGGLSSTGLGALAVGLAAFLPLVVVMARQLLEDLRARRGGLWYASENRAGRRRVVRVAAGDLPHRRRDPDVVAWGYFGDPRDARTAQLLGQSPVFLNPPPDSQRNALWLEWRPRRSPDALSPSPRSPGRGPARIGPTPTPKRGLTTPTSKSGFATPTPEGGLAPRATATPMPAPIMPPPFAR